MNLPLRKHVKARPIPPKVVLFVLIIAAVGAGVWWWQSHRSQPIVNSFDECAKAGNPILESYPEQCTYNGRSFFREDQAPPIPY